ncbi:MAG TPA: glycerol-3-phosphate dehydrogenase/oxidase [Gemmatimonadales bacterium]
MHRDLSSLARAEFDLVVIGGGICGAAVAWDAAQRGLAVALVERGDFGGATSAESLKVVHGGIRYLQHLDVIRVRESARERSALLRIAPHLVHPLPIVIPAYGRGMSGPVPLTAAFHLLGALTGGRNRGIADPARHIPPARVVSRREALEWFPDLEPAGLTGAGIFWDGQLYNPPRLVWAFLRSAANAGAVIANYCEAMAVLRRDGRATGVRVEDRLSGDDFEVRARIVVNAAGPYGGPVLSRSGLAFQRPLHFSRDMAVVLGRPFVTARGLAVQTRYRDPDALLSRGNRHVFLLPWRGRTLAGVHSIVWRDEPDALRTTDEEVAGFVAEVAEAAPWLGVTEADVAVVLAGLLPIAQGDLVERNVSFGKRPIVVDHAGQGCAGLFSAVTNRYTVARGVAERVVDLAGRRLGRAVPPCRTENTPLYGGEVPSFASLARQIGAAMRLDAPAAERLAHDHGAAWPEVRRIAAEQPGWGEPIGGTTVLPAEVVLAVRNELACRLADVVFRRTGLGTAGHPGDEVLERVAALAARELGWDAARRETELDDVRTRLARGAPTGSGVPATH